MLQHELTQLPVVSCSHQIKGGDLITRKYLSSSSLTNNSLFVNNSHDRYDSYLLNIR